MLFIVRLRGAFYSGQIMRGSNEIYRVTTFTKKLRKFRVVIFGTDVSAAYLMILTAYPYSKRLPF